MADFITLLNRGHRRYIDKVLKKREFGKCESCSLPALLVLHIDHNDIDCEWKLCERCYDSLLEQEEI